VAAGNITKRTEGQVRVAGTLILPVPEVLSAVYLVPTWLGAAAARERAAAELSAHIPEPFAGLVAGMLDAGTVRVSDMAASEAPLLPAKLQQYHGADSPLVAGVAAASHFVAFGVTWQPGWPPVHESAARACAAVVAADLRQPVVDTFAPQVLTPERAIATLPDVSARFKLTDWMLVSSSPGPQGASLATKGLGRFGLPELQVSNVPPQLSEPWAEFMMGIAARLLSLWLEALRARDGTTSAEVPSSFDVREADVALAYDAEASGDGKALVLLALDPATDDRVDSFLTVRPPDDFPGSAGEYLAQVSAQALNSPDQEIQVTPRAARDQAVAAARELLPSVRERFRAGTLPNQSLLVVKHMITAPGGGEYPWAQVTSWDDPATIFGLSTADAPSDPRVRAGRPIVLDAEAIVDWAIWVDGQGVVEGGLASKAAHDGDQGSPGPG
jgi:hypothetical protein